MLLLALDTSSAAVTAAVHDGSAVLASRTDTGAQEHGELLAPVVDAVLRRAGITARDLTQVVVGVGPGPFTGLRVGIALGSVVALAADVPVGGVCSLDALAWAAVAAGTVDAAFAVATDARRREVYLARYAADGGRQGALEVKLPADVPDEVRLGPVVGTGALLYPDTFADPREPGFVSGDAIAGYALSRLAAGDRLLPPTPLYLRAPDAVPPVMRKRVTA